MVMLLHREDVYEKESTRPGEADLIVAKHRNGPTKTSCWHSRATTPASSIWPAAEMDCDSMGVEMQPQRPARP